MKYTKIIYELKDGIAFITLNDPDNRNALSGTIVDELGDCLDECADDTNVRAIILRGSGPAFSAGANVKGMKDRVDSDYIDMGPGIRKVGRVALNLRHTRKPIIASIHGAAAGVGFVFAMLCDFRIVSSDSKYVCAFVNIGLLPDSGAFEAFISALGVPKATDLFMTGRVIKAEEALNWGLVNEVVPKEELEEATLKLANKLAQGPSVAYGLIKTMINKTAFNDLTPEIQDVSYYQTLAGRTEDHREAVYAFLEKRKPVFKGY